MKLGQKICPNEILDEFQNGSGLLKNIATRWWAIFLIWLCMAIVKHCFDSRGHIYCPIFMKRGHKICPKDMLDEFVNDVCRLQKTWPPGGRGFFPYMAI